MNHDSDYKQAQPAFPLAFWSIILKLSFNCQIFFSVFLAKRENH